MLLTPTTISMCNIKKWNSHRISRKNEKNIEVELFYDKTIQNQKEMHSMKNKCFGDI